MTMMAAARAPVRHLLTLQDYTKSEILGLVRRSLELKRLVRSGIVPTSTPTTSSCEPDNQVVSGGLRITRPPTFTNKTLGMVFTKRSTRTRVSSETGWAYYGGHPLFLGKDDIQLGAGEPVRDTATVIGSMVDLILARVGSHSEIEEFAKYSSVPVINALSDRFHPLQILADLTTLYEIYAPKALDEILQQPSSAKSELQTLDGLHVAWIGDANNILHSMLAGMLPIGIRISAACPPGYDVDPGILAKAIKRAAPSASRSHAPFQMFRRPEHAVKDADVIVTDTWVSMGQESEKARRLNDFRGFQVTEVLARRGGAKPDWKFLHCLPRKPEEVDDEVFYNKTRSAVFQQAENRKYAVMAVYEFLMKQKQRQL